jgi:hypothetical protein
MLSLKEESRFKAGKESLNFLGFRRQVHNQVTVKVNVKLSLYFLLTEHHAMKAYWGSGSIAPFFDLGTGWS